MRRVFYLLVLVTLGSSDVSVGGVHTGEKLSTTEPLHNNNPNTYQYLAPTGYYNYNNNNGYNNGYNGYYQQQNHQKQDLFNFGSTNGGGGFTGGNDLDGGFDASSIGGSIGTVLAALGLKGVTKLGIAVALLFFFVIIPLFILPGLLSLIAIIMAGVSLGGVGGVGGNNGSWMDNIKQMIAKNDDGQRALSTFYKFVNNEECIEKISCAISQRAYSRSLRTKSLKPDTPAPANNKESGKAKSKGSFVSRISRALSTDDCRVYACSYFS